MAFSGIRTLFTTINPHLTKEGGGYLADFSHLVPQNQKESNLSHLGDLSDIFRSHFDENKLGVPLYPGIE